MCAKRKKRYSAYFKFYIVIGAIKGEKSAGQLARAYNVHPVSILRWEKAFVERARDFLPEANT